VPLVRRFVSVLTEFERNTKRKKNLVKMLIRDKYRRWNGALKCSCWSSLRQWMMEQPCARYCAPRSRKWEPCLCSEMLLCFRFAPTRTIHTQHNVRSAPWDLKLMQTLPSSGKVSIANQASYFSISFLRRTMNRKPPD
jgi:hypothetical protein